MNVQRFSIVNAENRQDPERAPFIVVRMLRRWSVVRDHEVDALPPMIALARELGYSAQLGFAFHSLLQLVEGTLERPLRGECFCSKNLGADEIAVIDLIRSDEISSSVVTTARLPHGLPMALVWAVRVVRKSLDLQFSASAHPPHRPFNRIAEFSEASPAKSKNT